MRHGRICIWTVICTVSISLPVIANADIYRSVDQKGNIIFSDSPVKGAKKIELPPAQTYTASMPKPASKNTTPNPTQAVQYDAIMLTGITAESTLPHNQPISVSVSSTPPLQGNDQYGVLVDGKPVGAPQTSGQFTIPGTGLVRGEHRAQAVIVNKKSEVLKQSDPITFYIFQPSLQLNTHPQSQNSNNAVNNNTN